MTHARAALSDDAGQALVLGAVLLLAVALATASVVSVGQAAHDRVALQQAADAEAYSLAALEARAFNFFAYTNRALVAHYQTSLTLMAWLSFVLYIDHTFGRLLDLLQVVPVVQGIARALKSGLDVVVRLIDRVVPAAMTALDLLNGFYHGLQLAMLGAVGWRVTRGSGVLDEMLPQARGLDDGAIGTAAGLLNGLLLGRAIDWENMSALVPGLPGYQGVVGPDADGSEARIIMTELVNAARHPWVAGAEAPAQGGAGARVMGHKEDFDLLWVFPVSLGIGKEGRTELGMLPSAGGPRRHARGGNRRDQIYSVDALTLTIEVAGLTVRGSYESVVAADARGGFHQERFVLGTDCEADPDAGPDDPCLTAGMVTDLVSEPINAALAAYQRALQATGRHHYFAGVLPYVKFDPSPDPRQLFHQPAVVAVARLDPPPEGSPSREFRLAPGVFPRPARLRLGPTPDDPGKVAVACAQAYYHRPGEWQEHPNFFNPFWGARLMPLADHPLLDRLGLGALTGRFVLH